MKFRIRKCIKCQRYTLKESCPLCGGLTKIAHPAKFSPYDKYFQFKSKFVKKKE